MGYLTEEQKKEFNNSITLKPGEKANVVFKSYEPFMYGPSKDKKMPKHIVINADTNTEMEFVGFKFHDALTEISDDIVESVTIVEVECIDNGTAYPDYEMKIMAGAAESASDAF
jgi:hypothetical protein